MILWGCLAFIVGMVFGACTHEHLWSFVASLAGVCEAARQAGCDFVKLENTDDSEDEEEKKKNIHSKVKSKPKMATLDEGRAVFLNFPAGLVDHLSFAKDGRLVHEFWYNEKEKEILYDDPGATDEAFWDRWCRWLEPVGRRKEPVPLGEFKYAKLITKNSAHNELGVVLVLASLTIYTLATQADFAMECLETYMERGNHLEAVWDHPEALWNHLEAAYAVIFALKLLTWVAINWVPAKRHIEADKKAIGDFVRDLCSVERAKTRIFVLLFLLLGVPSELTDAPIQLHIRKPVQPYAVFKAKGHRAWVLGWKCKDHWLMETRGHNFTNLWVKVVFQLPLLLLQIGVLSEEPLTHSMVAKFVVSVMDVLVTGKQLYTTVGLRTRYYNTLLRCVEGGLDAAKKSDAAKESGKKAVNELIVNHKLLHQHFGEPFPKDVEEELERMTQEGEGGPASLPLDDRPQQ